MDIFNKAMLVNEEQDDQLYRYEVPVTVYTAGSSSLDVETPDKALISYYISIEHKSWGLAGINVTLKGSVVIPATVHTEAGDEDIEITVDLEAEDVQVSWSEGRGLAPSDLTVTISEEAGYPVKEVEVDFYYLKP